jgi:hypothetical protein
MARSLSAEDELPRLTWTWAIIERFVDVNLSKVSNITSGQIYTSVLSQERQRRLSGRDGPG